MSQFTRTRTPHIEPPPHPPTPALSHPYIHPRLLCFQVAALLSSFVFQARTDDQPRLPPALEAAKVMVTLWYITHILTPVPCSPVHLFSCLPVNYHANLLMVQDSLCRIAASLAGVQQQCGMDVSAREFAARSLNFGLTEVRTVLPSCVCWGVTSPQLAAYSVLLFASTRSPWNGPAVRRSRTSLRSAGQHVSMATCQHTGARTFSILHSTTLGCQQRDIKIKIRCSTRGLSGVVVHLVQLHTAVLQLQLLCSVPEGAIVRCIVRLDETLREARNIARVIGDPLLYKVFQTLMTVGKCVNPAVHSVET